MNELIVIGQAEIGGAEVNTVSARDLHASLGVVKDFSTWIKAQIERARLVEGRDYVAFSAPPESGAGNRGARIEYHLTTEAAKHVAMMSGTDKGFEVRDYFIECERRAKQAVASLPDFTNPAIAARAWADQVEARAIAEKTTAAQAKQIEEQKPLVDFAEKVAGTNNSVNLGDFAKAISGKGGFIIGRNSLFELLRAWSILDRRNQPYQHYIEIGWFTVREGVYENEKTNGPRVCFTTLVTGKGQIAIHKKIAEYFDRQKVAANA